MRNILPFVGIAIGLSGIGFINHDYTWTGLTFIFVATVITMIDLLLEFRSR